MADKQTQALKRLTKKLSAMRKTLRKDERDILDQLVVGGPAGEVQAHKIAGSTQPMITILEKSGSYVVEWEGPEVEGHLMETSVTPKVSTKIATKVQA
jgi:hypothetical protein